ncbi:hypothetical protein MMC08_001385 [Hypocenomyce scalaris]|nr:hypothetical protein [Hypocenomyce scalaris]
MSSINCPLIALEEHWLSQHVVDFYASKGKESPYHEVVLLRRLHDKLTDLGEGRIKAMDEASVHLQIVSHAPNSLPPDLSTCVAVNNELAQAVRDRPGRYMGFAMIPMSEPTSAAAELERCVKELGFVGTLIDSNCGGRFYDDEFFWPVFAKAEELDVPIYLHPSYNEQSKRVMYDGNYPDAIAQTIGLYCWGWHSECAVHIIRLFAAKVFDKFPKIKIIIGHMGEMLPFQLDRVDRITSTQWPLVGVKPNRPIGQVWDENLWITTSGMFTLPPMAAVVRRCKPDRILFSVDYPFSDNKWGVKFLEDLKRDGMVTPKQLEMIAYKNAEKLFGIKV